MIRALRPQVVVFDLDGTLLDSMPLVFAAIAHAIEPFAAPRTHDEIFARLGGPPDRFLAALVEDREHLPAARQRLDAFDQANAHLIQPYDGVRVFLETLQARGVRAAIWTGRDRVSADWLLRRHQLDGFFAEVLCGDDLPSHKPDPEGLREIMRRLGVVAAETLFVGDADVDVLGGVGCGVDTLLIHHARTVAADITSRSWRVVASPREAFDLVLRRVGPGG